MRHAFTVAGILVAGCATGDTNSFEPASDASSRTPETDAMVVDAAISRADAAGPGPNLLRNPSFEDGWDDLPPAPGNLINQQPRHWSLVWIEPGDPLFGAADHGAGVPECVHKLSNQLPPSEQPGQPDALILDGNVTYKMFHFGASFGAQLSQEISGLEAGVDYDLLVPGRIHLHGDGDPFSAEMGVWVTGADLEEGGWGNSSDYGDRSWHDRLVQFTAPASGRVTITLRVKSKWNAPKDFFIDALSLTRAVP